MVRESTARQVVEPDAEQGPGDPRFGDGQPPSPPFLPQEPIISNARLAVLMLLAAESMFFAGLLGASIVFRVSTPDGPPPFQPRLPVLVTGINTLVLLASGVTMNWALRAVRGGQMAALVPYIGVTATLGTLFLG